MAELKLVAEKALSELKNKNADLAQVTVSESMQSEMTIEGKEFTLYRTLFNSGITINAFKDQKKGTYATNKTDDESISMAVGMAMESAEAGNVDEAYGIAPFQGEFVESEGPKTEDEELLYSRMKEFTEDVAKEFKKINLFQIIGKFIKERNFYLDTNGTSAEKEAGLYQIVVEFSALEGEKTTSLDYAGFATHNLDKPIIEFADVRTKLSNAEKQLDVTAMEGKFVGTLVLEPAITGGFVRNIMNMAGGTAILEKTSIYLDKLNTKIADERLSVVFDEDDERIVGTDILTPDGFKTKKFTFIENGVLKNFNINYLIAKKTGFTQTSNNCGGMMLTPGEKSIDEIIKGVKRGLLCCGFSGGKPGINGEFSGVAKNSFLIEDGKITKAVTETMISGNFATMLNSLVDISKETVCEGGSVLPYTAFDGVTISGK